MLILQRNLLMIVQAASYLLLSVLMTQSQQLVASMKYMKRITCPEFGILITCLQNYLRNAETKRMK